MSKQKYKQAVYDEAVHSISMLDRIIHIFAKPGDHGDIDAVAYVKNLKALRRHFVVQKELFEDKLNEQSN